VWESEPKKWGLAEKLTNQKKDTAAAKEQAFYRHLAELDARLEQTMEHSDQSLDHANIVGLGKSHIQCYTVCSDLVLQ
jgi:hypothetical protein